MSNIRGLYDDKDDDPKDDDRDSNNRYVGGIGSQGGGSGLAVEPNTDDRPTSDSIFDLAESEASAAASAAADGEEPPAVRRTITMYREGFVVDDGPYRRLDDPSNRPFLRSLARGQTPDELRGDSSSGNTTVGLVDKRNEDYVEKFRSFSGAGQSLGGVTQDGASSSATAGAAAAGVFDPSALPPVADDSGETAGATTSIAVRLLDGSRKVVKISLGASVEDLAARIVAASSLTDRFRIVAGFPPKPLQDGSQTVEQAGLKGARVSLQKA